MSEEGKVQALIGPSLLACDLSRMYDESVRVMEAGADYLHLDVMDGHFVPNLSFGAPVVKCLRNNMPEAFLDVHLMVSNPMDWVGDMAEAGASNFTFHIESCVDFDDSIPSGVTGIQMCQAVKEAGMRCGVSVKPGTDIDLLIPLIEADLIMTVEPGFGGQKFMAEMMDKVRDLRQRYPLLDIEVDGGLGPSTIQQASEAGSNMIVAGSSVFKSESPGDVIRELKSVVENGSHLTS